MRKYSIWGREVRQSQNHDLDAINVNQGCFPSLVGIAILAIFGGPSPLKVQIKGYCTYDSCYIGTWDGVGHPKWWNGEKDHSFLTLLPPQALRLLSRKKQKKTKETLYQEGESCTRQKKKLIQHGILQAISLRWLPFGMSLIEDINVVGKKGPRLL